MDNENAWRDESKVPLDELSRAMGGGYAGEGQADDVTGGEAGAEAAFGDEAVPESDAEASDTDPDPDTAEGRRLRPSPEGRTGPV